MSYRSPGAAQENGLLVVPVAVQVRVAVLFSLHFTWSMCFDIVDSIVAAVVAGDMGAIAGAIPAKEKGGRPHPCDCRGFMYKVGAVRDCVHGGSVRYTLHHLLVEAWSAYEQASSTEKAMVLAFAGEKLVLPCCRRWARDSRGRSKCQVSPMVMLFVLQSDCSSIGRAV